MSSQTLFDFRPEEDNSPASVNAPLAVRMRPRTIDEVIGQDAALGKGSLLRDAIIHDTVSSIILFGPAGTGKTSIAQVIAHTTKAVFVEVSAIGGTVADLRREIEAAKERRLLFEKRSILFIDEIHRFNRSQQDALLHAVENGDIILVGATTENPFFEVNTALISRSRVVELKPLGDQAIQTILQSALQDERGLNGAYSIDTDALHAIIELSGGDARCALTTLELAASLANQEAHHNAHAPKTKPTSTAQASQVPGETPASPAPHTSSTTDTLADSASPSSAKALAITLKQVQAAVPHRSLVYDKNRDTHYDVISAFIKSMRGSDPDAALYWLARMIEGGEDPKFIARRIFILASEDIGNADPQALLIAEAAFRAAEVIGYPECRINLAQATIYMCLAPKSNAVVEAIDAAQSEVRKGPARAVPNHLRDRTRPGSEAYGSYLYPHMFDGAWVDQQYLPDGLSRGCFYHPRERGWEDFRMNTYPHNRGTD